MPMMDRRFEKVRLKDASFYRVHVDDTRIRAAEIRGVRMSGVELVDVEIDGELRNVVVNGVDIAPLVEAELNRRMPERAAMRPDTVDGFRAAWTILERLWAGTIARARAFPPDLLHRGVGEEWSFIQTLRHLNYARATWVDRMILGDPAPWHRLDLPWDEAPDGIGTLWDRDARPSLDDVLAVRERRSASVRAVLASLTADQLAATVTRTGPGWPQLTDFPVRECLHVVLNEEWEHRLYAERDLTVLEMEN
jgi:hypothetical protein